MPACTARPNATTALTAALAALPLALAACAPLQSEPPDTTTPHATDPNATDHRVAEQTVVYGDDDRREFYEVDEAAQQAIASTVTLIYTSDIDDEDPDALGFDADTLAEDDDVCTDERFADQPTASSCSAFLIDDRLVVTAGHCLDSAWTCPEEVFLFGYWYVADGVFATVTEDDVYACRRVVAFDDPDVRGGVADYAVIELDRPVTSAEPLPVDVANVSIGDGLTLVGYPDQLPAKYAPNGEVIGLNWRDGTAFGGTVDAFGGNSGSAVLNDDGEVVGILVAGEEDYVWDRRNSCNRVNVLPQDGGEDGGETITEIGVVIAALCGDGYPSERLCDTFGECGDGFCTGDEDYDSCEADCGAGPGVPPPGWTCDPSYYFVGDDCDCGCGIRDPDCDDPELRVYGCDDGEVCSDDGACVNPEMPASWTCDADWYAAGDDCDCQCGAYDPDCDDPDLRILNCEDGETCGSDGTCVGGSEPDAGVDAGVDAGSEDATEDIDEDATVRDGGAGDTRGDGHGAGDVAEGSGVVDLGDTGAVHYPRSGGSGGCAAAERSAPSDRGWALLVAVAGGLVATRRRKS